MEPVSASHGRRLIYKILMLMQEAGNARRVYSVQTRDKDDRIGCPYSREINEIFINGQKLHIQIYWDTSDGDIDYMHILEFGGRKFNSVLNRVERVEDIDDADYCHKLYWLNVATLCENLNINYLDYLIFLPIELQYID